MVHPSPASFAAFGRDAQRKSRGLREENLSDGMIMVFFIPIASHMALKALKSIIKSHGKTW